MRSDRIHAYCLAFVVGLGTGVLVMDVAAEHHQAAEVAAARERAEMALELVARASLVVETYQEACGQAAGVVAIREPRR